ncbi:hypothetical protein GCM10025760_33390 [Microbacterium yannicii]|uniref:Uncharacterized protein n=1 Tax=Microbacterium yannicii TaxID=671622 RepID=A0ABP9MP69_9MICO
MALTASLLRREMLPDVVTVRSCPQESVARSGRCTPRPLVFEKERNAGEVIHGASVKPLIEPRVMGKGSGGTTRPGTGEG